MTGLPNIIGPNDPLPARGKYLIAVPGELAPIQRFELPRNIKGAPRIAIAKQQLNDRLGHGADGLAVIPIGGGIWTEAVVCATEQAQEWCGSDAARNSRCIAVVPDMLALPYADETLTVDVQAGRVRARGGATDGFTAPSAYSEPLLEKMVLENGLKYSHSVGEIPDPLHGAIDRFGFEPGSASVNWNGPNVDLRSALASNDGVRLWIWGAAASLALLAFGLWAGSVWVETRALRDDAALVRAETVALLREGLIPNGPIIDVRQQVAQVMAQGEEGHKAEGSGPVDLLSRASIALFGTGLEVGTMTYEQAAEALDIEVTAATFADVDQAVASLAGGDLTARASEMRNDPSGGVSARLRLTFQEVAQ